MEKIKSYKVLVAAVVAIGVVTSGSYFYMRSRPVAKEPVMKAPTSLLEGQVVRQFEGENKIIYKMDIPETATSTTGMEGALVKITDGTAPFVSMYFSYEGGRGYVADDYIRNVIAPRIPHLSVVGTTTAGIYTWTVAESSASEWHVAQVGDGQWLLVVENKKELHDKASELLGTLVTE